MQEPHHCEYPIVEVYWLDHESNGGPGWEELEDQLEWAKAAPALGHSVGYLIYSCDTHIVIADTIMMESQTGCANKIVRTDIIQERLLLNGRPKTQQAEGHPDRLDD